MQQQGQVYHKIIPHFAFSVVLLASRDGMSPKAVTVNVLNDANPVLHCDSTNWKINLTTKQHVIK